MTITMSGIDIAKSVFHLHVINHLGRQVKRKKLLRGQLLQFLAQVPVFQIAIEACGSSHQWAREIQRLGHEVLLISPQYVTPFRLGNKNDYIHAVSHSNPDKLEASYGRFMPILVKAVQELSAKVTALEAG